MIILHTLGDTLITIGDRKIRPSSPLVFASLLYLATERGRRVPRTALQELLFPKAGERSGAHSLRQLLYKLRQLGAPLEADATSVYLSADKVRDDAATNGASHSAVVSFLPDFEPDISEGYSEWLEQKRAAFAASLRKRLVASIEANRESLNWQVVERDAHLLLSVDPFNEVGTFALAEAVALSGSKAAAMRILSEYERETGRTDLRLPASLLRRRISQAVPDTPVPTLSALPFVGRDAEVKELRKYIARARAGQPCLYVIGGEAGIGKTRLLTEVAALAALEGVSVFTVRCQAHYASRPLSVFIELVPALRAAPGALGVSPQSLASLNSLTSHTDEQSERPPDARDDMTRSETLVAAIRDLVDAVVSESPLLVAVEDAQWADHDSLRELDRLVHHERERPLIILCTTRSPEILPYSGGADDSTVIRRLKPLDTESMGGLAERLLPEAGRAYAIDVAEWSVRTAGGNPLFLQMLCSHYAATGEATVPIDVLAAVTRRVQQLPESQRRLLATCALLGRHGTVSVLRDLTTWSHVQLLEAVQCLEEQGYIILVDERLCVAHDLLAQAVLSLVPPASTCVLHACVASSLERQYDLTNDAALLWDCTEQWLLSGDATKAIAFLIRCGRHAIQIGRAAEAIKLLTRARQIARNQSDMARVDGELVLAARAVAQWKLALEGFTRWNALSDRHECSEQDSMIEFVGLEALWFTTGDPRQAIPTARRYCNETRNTFRRVEAARLLVVMAHEQCDHTLADEAYACAEPLLRKDSADHSNRLLPIHYHSVFGDRDIAMSLLNRMTSEIESFDRRERFRVATNAAAAYAMLGEQRRAHDLSLMYAPQAEAMGSIAQALYLVSHAVTALMALDCVDAARALHERALSLATELHGVCDSVHLANEAEIALWLRNPIEATGALQRLDSLKISSPRFVSYLEGLRTRISQLDGGFVLGSEAAAALSDLHRRTSRFVSADGLTQAIAEDFVRRGDSQRASAFVTNYVAAERRERGHVPAALAQLLYKPKIERLTHEHSVTCQKRVKA